MEIHTKPFTLVFTLVMFLGLTLTGRAIISGETLQISGHVKDDLGNPVADVDVASDDYVGDVDSAKTDANGYYVVDLKAEGNYRLMIYCAQLNALGYGCVNPGAVSITSGSAELDFIVHPAAPALLITNTFLPEGEVGAVYKTQLGAKGGRPPYKWQLALDSTNLPAGLVLNPRGLLSGTPLTNSVSPINVQVTDSNSTVTNKAFFIIINSGPSADTTASSGLPNSQGK